ncbi:hypothetical protein ZHAS_00008128 [Anopheles sinensis]|uniref:Uncharacterized protein n=1 Tax=Anopheles sinensis TaxID=74873 RepID=A0A084VRM3_ANOSI|nr:hypothetical protein ZHAS_00008128 [Anopheles sinensis]
MFTLGSETHSSSPWSKGCNNLVERKNVLSSNEAANKKPQRKGFKSQTEKNLASVDTRDQSKRQNRCWANVVTRQSAAEWKRAERPAGVSSRFWYGDEVAPEGQEALASAC